MRFKPASMVGEIGLAARDIFELPDKAMAGERDRPVAPATIGFFRTGLQYCSLNVLVPGRALRYYLSQGGRGRHGTAGFHRSF